MRVSWLALGGSSLLAAALSAAGSCVPVIGEWEVRGSSGSGANGAGAQCNAPEDCSPEQTCSRENYCRKKCLVDEECAPWRSCELCYEQGCSSHCTADPGQGCEDSSDCGTGNCLSVDSRNQPVSSYCSPYCESYYCPSGFECRGIYCYAIGAGGPVCYQPNTANPCAGCIAQHCYSELHDCCERGGCDSLYEAIDRCDATRTYDDCNVFYGDSYQGVDLLDCTHSYCESACWNPCPGEDCL
jgi:hypothetical protein